MANSLPMGCLNQSNVSSRGANGMADLPPNGNWYRSHDRCGTNPSPVRRPAGFRTAAHVRRKSDSSNRGFRISSDDSGPSRRPHFATAGDQTATRPHAQGRMQDLRKPQRVAILQRQHDVSGTGGKQFRSLGRHLSRLALSKGGARLHQGRAQHLVPE